MDEIGDALDTIDGLRVYRWPADAPAVPAAIVLYPAIRFNEAFQRGADLAEGEILVVAGRAFDRAARDAISKYCDGDSASSVMGAIYSHTFTSCSFCHVTDAEPDFVQIAGVDYIGYRFPLAIGGPGTST
jgi:hypothetical protein